MVGPEADFWVKRWRTDRCYKRLALRAPVTGSWHAMTRDGSCGVVTGLCPVKLGGDRVVPVYTGLRQAMLGYDGVVAE